jgi:hypothetical protein
MNVWKVNCTDNSDRIKTFAAFETPDLNTGKAFF